VDIYLPIAEVAVNAPLIVLLGAVVGFISGMFGIGGGFLMTPMLVFFGIPAPVAVASMANHVAASSMSSVIAYGRRKAVDLRMGAVLTVGGILGAGIGVLLFRLRLFRLVGHLLKGKFARPGAPLGEIAAGFETRYWKDSKEYWHMFWNNAVLLSLWGLMSWAIGPVLFFSVYLCSVSLAGGVGLVVFTVQHNFEHSYAPDSEDWDSDAAAIHGTCFLDLPRWLGWFTANIAYHHIHHLSYRIPNYCLAECHNENRELFSGITRIGLRDIPQAMKCVLWDVRAGRIIGVAEYRQQAG